MVEQLARLHPGVYDGELVSTSGQRWDVRARKSGLTAKSGEKLVLVLFDVLELGGESLWDDTTVIRVRDDGPAR